MYRSTMCILALCTLCYKECGCVNKIMLGKFKVNEYFCSSPKILVVEENF